MPTIDFGGCLANHWFVWSINGVGTILAMVVNMVVSYVLLKSFSSLSNNKPSVPKRPTSDFSRYDQDPSDIGMQPDPMMYGEMQGPGFNPEYTYPQDPNSFSQYPSMPDQGFNPQYGDMPDQGAYPIYS